MHAINQKDHHLPHVRMSGFDWDLLTNSVKGCRTTTFGPQQGGTPYCHVGRSTLCNNVQWVYRLPADMIP